eukprot:6196504-Pleurochrysis_carterae.AAC.1
MKPRLHRQWLDYCLRNDLYAAPPSPNTAHAIEQGISDASPRNENLKHVEEANEAKAYALYGVAHHGWETRDSPPPSRPPSPRSPDSRMRYAVDLHK